MKKSILLSAVLFFTVCLFTACEKDIAIVEEEPPPAPTTVNLISNPSFEINGQSSLQGWWSYQYQGTGSPNIIYEPFYTVADTSYSWWVDGLHYSNDAPNGGGNSSIQVTSAHWDGRTLLTFIAGHSGTNIFKLSFYAKGLQYISPGTSGTIIGFGKWSSSSSFPYMALTDTIHQWKQYTRIDTITTLSTDTIAVYIHSYAGQQAKTDYLFDNIELEKVEQ